MLLLTTHTHTQTHAREQGLSPSMFFFNAAGREIEKLEVNGMFDYEMVEELEKRGIHPRQMSS